MSTGCGGRRRRQRGAGDGRREIGAVGARDAHSSSAIPAYDQSDGRSSAAADGMVELPALPMCELVGIARSARTAHCSRSMCRRRQPAGRTRYERG